MHRLSGAACRFAALCLAAVGLWVAYVKLAFPGFMADPIWYLDPARQFAHGLGLVTRVAAPAHIAGLPPDAAFPIPFVLHGPVAPLLIGLGYKWFGVADWVPIALGFAFTFLTGCLLYRLASRVGDERTALTAAAFFWTSFGIVDSSVGASTDPPFILLVLAAVYCLWESRRGPRALAYSAAAGLALGLASCTRLAGQMYWLGFLAAAWWMHRRWKPVAAFAAALAAPLIPLAFHTRAAAGAYFYSPGYYVLNWSPSFPGFRSSTSFMNLSTVEALLVYPWDFVQKAVTGPVYAISRLIENAYGPYFMMCAVLGLATFWKSDEAAERFKRMTLTIAAPVFLFNAVISYGPVHYLNPLWPLLAVMAAKFLWAFVDANLKVSRRASTLLVIPALALLFLGPAALHVKDQWKARPRLRQAYEDLASLGAFLRQRVGQDEIIYTDDNRDVCWHADRNAVALTATMEDAEKTFRRLPADAVVLTSLRIDSEDYAQEWRDAFYERKGVAGFAPCAEFSAASFRALLLRRPGACR